MKILIIGGTRFVGRTIVETAVRQGHEITLFNRGKSNPELFPEVEKITGDRDTDIALLGGRTWDIAVDTCGYAPRIVRKSCEMLGNAVDRYIFISTINVYADYSQPGIDEGSQLATIEDETVEEVTGKTYGPLKALCENVVNQVYPGRSIILRCGLIVGPYDPTDRFTYWPVRVQNGGEVLAPSPPHMQVQFIDARDLADFILHLAENRGAGTFNTTGPAGKLSLEGALRICNAQTGNKASLTWVSEEFITSKEMDHIPVWTPKDWRGIFEVHCSKAISAGLKFRQLKETINDTLAWHATRPAGYELKVGLKPDKEKELLKIWHESIKKQSYQRKARATFY
ncbi:NAD-dependent epimerase/dehydratase family protein [candidate division WOR-3 bacterium]|nr:NAD-dependent epimerase/dehydratase family protein [candidate division WOR-3 bacterium]